MRILVVGGSGFIGRYLARHLASTLGEEVFCTFHSRPPGDDVNHWYQVELTDSVALERLFGIIQPEVVVHLAALADVGTAEREPERATAINVAATANIADLCRAHGSRMVFISTEYVFDGRQGFYGEADAPNPATHYGRTKLEGELATARLASDWSVARTSIVYGWPAPGRRNYVTSLVESLRRGETRAGSTHVMRSPVYVEHLVEGITRLALDQHPGIHHIAGRDWVSMYDFAARVAQGFGLDSGLVVPSSEETGKPDRLGLDCAATMDRLGLPHPGLAEGLAAMRANNGSSPGSAPLA